MPHLLRLLLLSLAAALPALASSCPGPPLDPSEEFARSEVVFSGEVIDVKLNVRGAGSKERFDRIRLQVDEVWKGNPGRIAEIWEEASGYDLRIFKGQTLLVYANRDAQGRITGGRCGRGGSLSSSGDDLAYLYFVKQHPERSSRLFGFITIDEADLKAIPRNWSAPPHPAWDFTLRLKGRNETRYLMGGGHGTFVFDGLTGGEYTLTIYGPGYLLHKRVVKDGIKVLIPSRGFAKQELYIPEHLLER